MTTQEIEQAARLLWREFDEDVAQEVLIRLLRITSAVRDIEHYVRRAAWRERVRQSQRRRRECLMSDMALDRVENGTIDISGLISRAQQETVVELSEVPLDIRTAELTYQVRLTSTQKTRRNRWRRRVENEPG